MSEIKNRFKKQINNIQASVDEYDGPNILKITPEKFNDGWCDHFAEVMSNEYSDINYMSADDIDSDYYKAFGIHPKSHAFIEYKNKYYDFENLDGVEHPFQLNFYKRIIEKLSK